MPGRTPEGDALTALVLPVFALNGEVLETAAAITAPHELTPARWRVLGAVLEEPLPVAEIARRVGLGRRRRPGDRREGPEDPSDVDQPGHRGITPVSASRRRRTLALSRTPQPRRAPSGRRGSRWCPNLRQRSQGSVLPLKETARPCGSLTTRRARPRPLLQIWTRLSDSSQRRTRSGSYPDGPD